MKDADFVYTDVWYGLYDKGAVEGRAHGHLLPDVPGHRGAYGHAAPDAQVHATACPPPRGEEVTDAVIDGLAVHLLGRGREPQALHPRSARVVCPQAEVDEPEADDAREQLNYLLEGLGKQGVPTA